MEAAKSRLQNAHAKAREKSDQVKLRVLNVGDLVLWKTPGLSKYLSTSLEGPFTVATRIGEVNYKISWKQGSKTHHKVVHINQLKPFKKSDSLPCHKVLTVLDQNANREDYPFIPDHFKGPDLSDIMKSELDNALSQFPSDFFKQAW